MRQRARAIAVVVLALWGAAAGAGVSACSVEGPVPRAPGGDEPAQPTPASPGPGPEGAPESPQPSSAEDDEDLGAENGQTGSLSPSDCNNDWDCTPVLENWRPGDVEYALLDSACEHRDRALRPTSAVPGCVCLMSVTKSERIPSTPEVSRQTSEVLFHLEPARRWAETFGGQCSVEGAVPGECAYCDGDFPGCDIDAAVDDCAEPCADAVRRQQLAAQVEHEVELRMARCDHGVCESVLRIDDACYGQQRARSSCALSDAEIVAAVGAADAGEQCEAALPPCQSAADCPAGLACNGRRCGPCLEPNETCASDASGQCIDGVFSCGEGEACITGVCILTERAECFQPEDCPTTDPEGDPRICLLTGIDNGVGRGNRETRSYCTSRSPNEFGLRVGDVLEARVLGPVDAVGSMFDPALSASTVPCGDGTGLAVGSALRLRVERLETQFWLDTRATLLEAGAPVDSVPAPVHPRDPPEGRQLAFRIGSPGNAQTLTAVSWQPSTLQGCPGSREIELRSLLARREPGISLPADGSFPTTVLTYKFSVAEEGYDDPACARWLRSGMCWDAMQVEVTRLTP